MPKINHHLLGLKYPRSASPNIPCCCEVIAVNAERAIIRNTRVGIYAIPVHIAQVIYDDQRDQAARLKRLQELWRVRYESTRIIQKTAATEST